MKFDIPGPHPRKVVLYRDNQERVYDLPFEATDPVDIEALSSVPGIVTVAAKPAPVPETPAPSKPLPPSKEVKP